jgi:hypothetical protein
MTACERGYRVAFATVQEWVSRLEQAQANISRLTNAEGHDDAPDWAAASRSARHLTGDLIRARRDWLGNTMAALLGAAAFDFVERTHLPQRCRLTEPRCLGTQGRGTRISWPGRRALELDRLLREHRRESQPAALASLA